MTVFAMWPSTLTLVAAVAVIGTRQLGLMVLMHEAAHWLILPDRRMNDRVAKWLCAYPLWGSLTPYRREHHLHHRHTQQPEDPDLPLTAPFPVTCGTLSRAALGDLTAWTVCASVPAWWRALAPRGWRGLRGPIASNAVLFAVLVCAGSWYLYPLLWLLPLATWYQLVSRLRRIAEHAVVPDNDDPLRNTRTTAAGLLARTFLAPYWVNYHLEHHLLVFVPCWKLRRAHALLMAKGYGERMELASGYPDVVLRVTSPRL